MDCLVDDSMRVLLSAHGSTATDSDVAIRTHSPDGIQACAVDLPSLRVGVGSRRIVWPQAADSCGLQAGCLANLRRQGQCVVHHSERRERSRARPSAAPTSSCAASVWVGWRASEAAGHWLPPCAFHRSISAWMSEPRQAVMPGPSFIGGGYSPRSMPRNQALCAIGRMPLVAGRPLRAGWLTNWRSRMKCGRGAVIGAPPFAQAQQLQHAACLGLLAKHRRLLHQPGREIQRGGSHVLGRSPRR